MGDNDMKRFTADDAKAQQQWDVIVKRAWRPAWSMRSRKGCLAPFVAWWRRRRLKS